MKTFARVGLAAVVLAGVAARPAGAAPIPATFDEYVGLGMYSAQGASLAAAESVNLTVTLDQWEDRGGGTGYATASNVLPLPAELDLAIYGGPNLSGMGATAYVQTCYQFSLDPDAGGLPANVPIFLTVSGSVTVDTSLVGSAGTTYAMIDYPGGQLAAKNYDAYGSYEGTFSFDETLGPLSLAAVTNYTISIYLYSHGEGSGSDFFYNSHAFLDPTIEIDPSFQYKDQFQVVYSQGIVVPEPATLALLALGALALIRRRR